MLWLALGIIDAIFFIMRAKAIRNGLSLVVGLVGGFYGGQHFPDVYYVQIRDYLPVFDLDKKV